MKVETFNSLQERIPERILEKAIKGMLPHNALGRQLFRKLKVYKGSEHPHAAQKPLAIDLFKIKQVRALSALIIGIP